MIAATVAQKWIAVGMSVVAVGVFIALGASRGQGTRRERAADPEAVRPTYKNVTYWLFGLPLVSFVLLWTVLVLAS